MAKTRRASRSRKASRKASRKQEGGKRKASSWASAVQSVFKEMRKNDPNVKLGAAMKEASRRRKAGKL